MQDWEIECADPKRVSEFLNAYETHAESEDEKFTLMALILGSFEEYHGLNNPSDENWARIKHILEEDLDIQKNHIENYRCDASA